MHPVGPPMAPYPPPPAPRSSGSDIVLGVLAGLVGLWIVGTTTAAQAVAWLVLDTLSALGTPAPSGVWALVAWVNAALVAIPAGLLWLLCRFVRPAPPAVVVSARAWTFAGIAGGVIGSARAVPVPHNELLLLLTAVLAALLALAVTRLTRGIVADSGRTPVYLAAAAGLLVLLPWLWAGALGGLAETVLAVLAAAAVGWLSASLLGGGYFAAYARRRWLLVLAGGLTAGVALLPVAAAVGGTGVSLAEMFVVPATGIAAAALAGLVAPARLGGLAIAVLVGLAAVGPLAFVDPEETSLVLGLSDVGYWTLVAAGLGILSGLLVSIAYGVVLRPRWTPSRWLAAALAVVALIAAAGVYGFAGRPGLYGERLFVVMAEQADLSGLADIPDRPTRLRETYKRLVDQADRTQAPLRAALDRWGLHYTPYYLVNGVMVDGGPVVRAWLSTRSDVDRVLLDPRLRPLPVAQPIAHGTEPLPNGRPQWNISLIGADKVWSEFGAQGQGIVIGTSDSGVDGTHPALKGSFRGGDDSWLDPWNGTATPTDHGGHGTHTLGTALGQDGIGVAPRAQWMGCVNLDRNEASPSRYLDCLQFMLAPYPPGADPLRAGRPERAADVLTNSWGCPGIEGCDLDSLRPATAALRAAGIFVVVAAGNSGPGCATVTDPPSPYPDVFTVGAVDPDGKIASFSSRGPTPDGRVKPDVVAPGVTVLSAFPGNTYASEEGTSMATPHVAGVVALLWSAKPALIGDIAATERLLRDTARPVPSDPQEVTCGAAGNVDGAGLVDAYAAVKAALSTG